MRIAVAGGTGVVGRYVVEAAEEAGHDVAVLTRSTGVDLVSGEGLTAGLDGVDVVIDAANADSNDQEAATSFFRSATANLQRLGYAAGVQRLIVLSIVGIDRVPTGYYAAKLEHERVALEGSVPTGIIRATQFHEYAAQIVTWSREGDVARIPDHRVQTVAARTVAERLVAAAESGASGITEVAGPEPAQLLDLSTRFVQTFDWGVEVIGFDPGVPPGSRLPGDAAFLGGPSFDDWLPTADAAQIALLL